MKEHRQDTQRGYPAKSPVVEHLLHNGDHRINYEKF